MYRAKMHAFSSMLSGLRLASLPLVRATKPTTAETFYAKASNYGQFKCSVLLQHRWASHQSWRSPFSARKVDSSEPRWGIRPAAAAGLCASICVLGYICGGSETGGVATALSATALLNGALLSHEGGHLAAAKALGVAVREFSVGIGPRVAWWQGATTTYSLRAIPLAGYVSFLTASHLSAGAPPAVSAGGRPLLLLLEWLPAGRRALVTAAGVAVNAVVAAALVGWQVYSYGDLDVVVRPGAIVRRAEGWLGPSEDALDDQQQQPPQQLQPPGPSDWRRLLQAGDVILSVGDRSIPARRDADVVLVETLNAVIPRGDGAVQASEQEEEDGEIDAARVLQSIQMVILRTVPTASATAATAGYGGSNANGHGYARYRKEEVHLQAADLLRYETLSVAPNFAVGCRRPRDLWEWAESSRRELQSWAGIVLGCWTQAISAAATALTSTSTNNYDTISSSSSRSSGAGGRSEGSSGGTDAGAKAFSQMVGPLGLVASAAALVAAERAVTAAADGPKQHSDGSCDMYDEQAVRQPPLLLQMGIQLNLQLAFVNLLPLPVLDGGQLVLLALEAARGGRRLPPLLERAALLGSGLAVGAWLLALSVRDLVGLMERAAGQLAASLDSTARPSRSSPSFGPTAVAPTAATAATGGESRVMVVQVAAGGNRASDVSGEYDIGAGASAAGAWAP